MDKFLKAAIKHHKKPHIAYAIACCIHHQFRYKKHDIFKLAHETLELFGINRKQLKPYLSIFQQEDLIQYTVSRGRSPTIQLLVLPDNAYIINNANIKQYGKPKTSQFIANKSKISNNQLLSLPSLVVPYTTNIINKQYILLYHAGVQNWTGYPLFWTGACPKSDRLLLRVLRQGNPSTQQVSKQIHTHPAGKASTYLRCKGVTYEP
jgi:hypothetical protein